MIDIIIFIWIAYITDPEAIRGDPGDPRSALRKIGKDRLQDRQLCPYFLARIGRIARSRVRARLEQFKRFPRSQSVASRLGWFELPSLVTQPAVESWTPSWKELEVNEDDQIQEIAAKTGEAEGQPRP